ncbi:hypothetical protein predicted by Glimmer/Critica [Bdellovibrio bacteriovorus HD100]|uniref:Uncharacterized protein n=1 Tax=Bdellovibrio bacteriovorus (strain ATCC 15356 / DSM 50701 / NCIMB 9529 / HD100) TaxID=264462 RepID=Q6MPH7_BDEBA|nr:hypothetical protein predicted by Glimmer/Critica [Bdellovibrio bacteriovorus HD100]
MKEIEPLCLIQKRKTPPKMMGFQKALCFRSQNLIF